MNTQQKKSLANATDVMPQAKSTLWGQAARIKRRLVWRFVYQWYQFRYWLREPKSRFDISYVLTKDQCVYGFDHTQDQLLLWLGECTLEAQERLHAEIWNQIKEYRDFRNRGIR